MLLGIAKYYLNKLKKTNPMKIQLSWGLFSKYLSIIIFTR